MTGVVKVQPTAPTFFRAAVMDMAAPGGLDAGRAEALAAGSG